ncbi:MAG TPA: hypothetical protein VJZ71_09330 [Phycisphaerae bacterium]|nr:hypothetical protein [Phycisphaerae bacterium]
MQRRNGGWSARTNPLLVCGLLVASASGCRLHPVSLASMAIGDVINDADVKKRQEELHNQPVSAADAMFGERQETLVYADDAKRELIMYPVKGDLLDSQNWVVESQNGKLVALSRVKRNIDGVEDVIKSAAIEPKVMGKSPEDCCRDAEFKPPIATLRCRESGEVMRVYDIRNWTNSRGARYCVLRFDENDRCKKINLIGVSASSLKDPLATDQG